MCVCTFYLPTVVMDPAEEFLARRALGLCGLRHSTQIMKSITGHLQGSQTFTLTFTLDKVIQWNQILTVLTWPAREDVHLAGQWRPAVGRR